LGLHNVYYKGGIHIYPNPTSKVVTFDNLDNVTFTYQIIALNGVLVKNATSISNTIDVSDFPNGTYTLRVFNANFNVLQKLIIIH
jgi:hypothetical protein